MKMDMKKNVIWNTTGSIYYSFCQWVMTVIVVYMTSDYGIIGNLGLAMTITNSFTTISSFGMRNFQVSDTEHKYQDADYIASRRITACLAFGLCAIYLTAIHTELPEMISILMYMLLRLIESTEDVYQGILQLNWRYDIIGKSYIIRGSLQIISFIFGFYLTENLTLTFALMVLSNFAVFVFMDKKRVMQITNISIVKASKKVFDLLKECGSIVVYNFMFNSLSTVVRVEIKQSLGGDELGIYSTIASPTVIVQLLASVVFTPFLPLFAKLYHEKDKNLFIQYIRKVILCISIGFVMVNIITIVLGKWGLNVLYGEKMASYDRLLLPLVWCTFFAAAIWLLAGILISIREIKPLTIGMFVAFIVNYILSKMLVKQNGLNGASYAQVTAEILLWMYLFILIVIKSNRIQESKM